MFWVPSDVYIWVHGENECTDQPPSGCVAMNFDSMASKVRSFLHLRISELLNFWNVALTQITPNGWSTIIGLLTIFRRVQARAFPGSIKLNFLTSLVKSDVDNDHNHA